MSRAPVHQRLVPIISNHFKRFWSSSCDLGDQLNISEYTIYVWPHVPDDRKSIIPSLHVVL